MKKQISGFIAGILVTILFSTLVIPAVATTINAIFNSVNISLDGTQVAKTGDNYTLSNGTQVPYSIVYNETTYLPIRKVSELTGLNIGWNGNTKTVIIGDQGTDTNTGTKLSNGTTLNSYATLKGLTVNGKDVTTSTITSKGLNIVSSHPFLSVDQKFAAGTFKNTTNIALSINYADISKGGYIGIELSSKADFSTEFCGDKSVDRYASTGWNWMVFSAGDLTNKGGESWDNVQYVRIRLFPASGATENITLGGLYLNPDLGKQLIFSFDDGNISDYKVAYPILKAAGIPGTFYVISGSVGNGYHITLPQLKEMYANGMDICNHSVSHVDLTKLTDDQVKSEVNGCTKFLTDNGMPRGAYNFSYPLSSCTHHLMDLIASCGIVTSNGSVQDTQTNPNDVLDFKELIAIGNTTTTDQIKAAIDKIDTYGGVGNIQCHKFADTASKTDPYTAATSMLQYAVDYAKQKGIQVITITDFVKEMQTRP